MSIKNVFAICFLIILVGGCKKEQLDYRERFVGTYDCTLTDYNWSVSAGSMPQETTHTSKVTVYVEKSALSDNKIALLGKEIQIDQNGNGVISTPSPYYSSEIHFENNKMTFVDENSGHTWQERLTYVGQKR